MNIVHKCKISINEKWILKKTKINLNSNTFPYYLNKYLLTSKTEVTLSIQNIKLHK